MQEATSPIIDTGAALASAEDAFAEQPTPENAASLRTAREAHELTLARVRAAQRRADAAREAERIAEAARAEEQRREAEAERATRMAALDSMTARLSRSEYLESIAPHVAVMVELVTAAQASIEAMADAGEAHAQLRKVAAALAADLGVPLEAPELSPIEAGRLAKLAVFRAIVEAHPLERRAGDWPDGMMTSSYRTRRNVGAWLDAPVDLPGVYAFARWSKSGTALDPFPLVPLEEKLRATLHDPDERALLRAQHGARAAQELSRVRSIACVVQRGREAEQLARMGHTLAALSPEERAEVAAWAAEGKIEHDRREAAWREAEERGYGTAGSHGSPVKVPSGGVSREPEARRWWTWYHESRGVPLPPDAVFRSFFFSRVTRSIPRHEMMAGRA